MHNNDDSENQKEKELSRKIFSQSKVCSLLCVIVPTAVVALESKMIWIFDYGMLNHSYCVGRDGIVSVQFCIDWRACT
jgi:hypothetical protein